MKKIIRIDHLRQANGEKDYLPLARDIVALVHLNMDYSNDGTYDEVALLRLKANKTVNHILKMIQTSLLICIYEDELLIACGFIMLQDDRYFSKSLHVHPMMRRKGLGQLICQEREEALKSMGVEEVFIESMKFPDTIEFHRSNGFEVATPYKVLQNTILMRKCLK